jgi:DNA-binding response OmpR family regulator
MKHLPKVLLIDDEVDYLDLLTTILRKRGFDVHSLSSGEDVLTVTKKFKPDVILLDVRLGNFDGRLICWQIKTEKDIKEVTIILHSAYSDIETEYKSFCADEFILKPTEIDYIVSRINSYLHVA